MDSDVDELAAALVRHCGAPPLASVEPVVEAVFLEFLEQFMEFTSPFWYYYSPDRRCVGYGLSAAAGHPLPG